MLSHTPQLCYYFKIQTVCPDWYNCYLKCFCTCLIVSNIFSIPSFVSLCGSLSAIVCKTYWSMHIPNLYNYVFKFTITAFWPWKTKDVYDFIHKQPLLFLILYSRKTLNQKAACINYTCWTVNKIGNACINNYKQRRNKWLQS